MSYIAKAHSLCFEIDNADWHNESDADIAASILEDKLQLLSVADARMLHSELLRAQEGGGEIPELARKLQDEAFQETTKDYANQPQSGHNLELYADAD